MQANFMTIIDQLEKTLTPAILGNDPTQTQDVATISLLEQFYALLIARLASADIYSQLLRHQSSLVESNDSLFEQLWPHLEPRQLMIDELSISHHIDKSVTSQLLTDATYLGYQELQSMADGQFLPSYLQTQQGSIRQYLPVWASTVILAPMSTLMPTSKLAATGEPMVNALNKEAQSALTSSVVLLEKEIIATDKPIGGDTTQLIHANIADSEHDLAMGNIENLDAIAEVDAVIQASPLDYRHTDPALDSSLKPRIQWLIPLLLIIIAVTALALLWFLVIQPKYFQPVVVAPVIAQPVVVAPAPPVVDTLLPIELTIAVDDSGGLYNCSAVVGDIALQNALQQALNTSFAEQSSLCKLTVQQGVATTFADINALPEVLTLIRSTPFARLQLRDNSFNLEAPDELLLQQLLANTRTLLPNTIVATTPSIALPNTVNQAIDNSGANYIDNNSVNNNSNAGSNSGFEPSYRPSDNDTNNQAIPNQAIPNQVTAPPRDDMNNSNANNNVNNTVNNNTNNRNQATGGMSLAEAENLANSAIVAEPLRNTRPVDTNVGN